MNCWRLNRQRELVQDVPLAIGMRVYYLSENRIVNEFRVGACQRDDCWRAYVPEFNFRAHPFAQAERHLATRLVYEPSRTYISHDAAIRACQLRMSDGESLAFWARITGKSDNEGCWEWVGEARLNGQGVFRWRDWTYIPHEVVFNLRRTGEQEGYITHTCGNRACCNYRHMEVK